MNDVCDIFPPAIFSCKMERSTTESFIMINEWVLYHVSECDEWGGVGNRCTQVYNVYARLKCTTTELNQESWELQLGDFAFLWTCMCTTLLFKWRPPPFPALHHSFCTVIISFWLVHCQWIGNQVLYICLLHLKLILLYERDMKYT